MVIHGFSRETPTYDFIGKFKVSVCLSTKEDIKAITHQTTRSADWYKEMSILMTTLVFSGLARHDYQKILRVCARQMITFAQDKKKL